MQKKYPALLLPASLCLLLLTGCYDVAQEVIRADDAVEIPNLPGHYTYDDGSTQLTIAAVPASRDYRFQRHWGGNPGKTQSGYLRAIHLKDDLYAIQVKYDDSVLYQILFYRFLPYEKQFIPMRVADQSRPAMDKLAGRYSVRIEFDYTEELKGRREDLLAFLRAHRELDFSPMNP